MPRKKRSKAGEPPVPEPEHPAACVTPAERDAAVARAVADERARERARCAAILGCPEARGRRALAEHLACHSEFAPAEAARLLAAAPCAPADVAGDPQPKRVLHG